MFCQSCGNPLVAITPTAPAGPPPGTPPPIVGPPPNIPPPSYQSPYYAPGSGAPQAPVHRAPWVLIVSAVVGLVVIMAGCGTALAVFNSRNANQSATGLGSTLETPSPAGSPSPVASASPTSTVPGQVSNPTLSVTVPSGWLLANKDNETITLIDPYGQSITIGSGPQNPPQTAQQNKSDLDTYFIGKYPDSKLCPNTKVTAITTGVSLASMAAISSVAGRFHSRGNRRPKNRKMPKPTRKLMPIGNLAAITPGKKYQGAFA